MTSRTFAAVVLAGALAGTTVAAQRGPAATAAHLPAEVLALACAPKAALEEPNTPLRITGGQDSIVRQTHSPGDIVTINAGSQNGIEVGQEYYTRRLLIANREKITPLTPATMVTSGWIRVWAVEETMSLATITHACDTVDVGDYLEPFALPTVPALSQLTGPPERGNYGLVLSGQDRRTQFGSGDYLLINRGSSQGVTAGARFVVYHDKKTPGNFLFQIAEAVAVNVNSDTATLQVLNAIDAISAGDYVGMRK